MSLKEMKEIISGRSFSVAYKYNQAMQKVESAEVSIIDRDLEYGPSDDRDKRFISLTPEVAREMGMRIVDGRGLRFKFNGQWFRIIDNRFECLDWIVVEDGESYLRIAWRFNRLARLIKTRLIWTLAIWNLAWVDSRSEPSWAQIKLVGKLSLWSDRIISH